ncbi:MAG TPA: SDR family oxidoreductase [Aquabacterium sp.]|nr:SDR family oxidoreductase [Aquabacterium sp.]
MPLSRVGLPQDIAQTACFLASDESSFITGQVIPVNGGAYI